MRMIFLGLLFCEESLQEAYKNCRYGVQMATHGFQSRLLEWLSSLDGVEVEVVGVAPVGSFPFNYKKPYSKSYRTKGHTQIGYMNLPFIKHKTQTFKIYHKIKKMARDEQVNILVYSLYEPFLDALVRLKKKLPNLHITILQPDAVMGRNGIIKSKKAVRIGNRLVKKAKCANDFVFLTEHVKDVIDLNGRDFCVVDCICLPSQEQSRKKEKNENVFLYTGSTAKEHGICNMVDAFSLIPEAKLWICGNGDADEYIRQMADKHENIRHFGYVSQKEVARLRDECDFLLNPRVPTGTFTQYSFPSKTAEYLMSGKPVVMYHLEGLGKEYDDMLNYLTAVEPRSLAAELRQIMQIPYEQLQKKAERARDYMVENKNAAAQAGIIIEMLMKGGKDSE